MSIDDEVAAQAAGRIVDKWRNKVIAAPKEKTKTGFTGVKIWVVGDEHIEEISVREYAKGQFVRNKTFDSSWPTRHMLEWALRTAIDWNEALGIRKFGDSIHCYKLKNFGSKPVRIKVSELGIF